MVEKKVVDETEAKTKASVKAKRKRQQIKEVKTKLSNLSPAVAAEVVNDVVAMQTRKQVNGFTNFLRENSVVSVGIGLVLGIQIKAVVDSIMHSFVDPLTKALLPGKDALSTRTVSIGFGGNSITFGWGAIVYSLFTFLMVAFIIYFAYKLLRLDKLKKES